MNGSSTNSASPGDDDARAKDLYKSGQLIVRRELGGQMIDRLSSRKWWRPTGNSPRFWARVGQEDPFHRNHSSQPLEPRAIYPAARLCRLDTPQPSQRTGRSFSRWEDPFEEKGMSSEDLKKRVQLWETEIPLAKAHATRPKPRPAAVPPVSPDVAPTEERRPPRPLSAHTSVGQTKGGRMRMSRPSSGSQKPTIVRNKPPEVK